MYNKHLTSIGGVVNVWKIYPDNGHMLTNYTAWSATDNYAPSLKVHETVACRSELYCQYLIYSNMIWDIMIRKIGSLWEGCLVIIIYKVQCVLYWHFFENWISWRGVILYAASSYIEVIWHVRPTQDRQQFIWYILWKSTLWWWLNK
jgi:hypothetical protein